MDVCVALSLGIANGGKQSSPYFNKVLTFDSTCEIVTLTALDDPKIDRFDRIEAAVAEIKNAGWGGSTNLESVFERIAELEEKRVHAEEDSVNEVVLIIMTDMQFDNAMQTEGPSAEMLKTEVLQAIYKHLVRGLGSGCRWDRGRSVQLS